MEGVGLACRGDMELTPCLIFLFLFQEYIAFSGIFKLDFIIIWKKIKFVFDINLCARGGGN